MHDLIGDRGQRATGEGRSAGQHLVHDRGERELIRRGIELVDLPLRLLRRHVLRRPQHRCHAGDLLGNRGDLRDAEIENLHPLGLAADGRHHEDVLRVHVAMDDAFQMRGGQRRAQLIGDVDHARERQGPRARQDLPQRLAFQVLHDQVGHPVGQGVEVDDRHDPGMSQARGHLRLTHEPRKRLRVIAHARVEELHRVPVCQARVGRLVDLTHAAAADPANDAVRASQQRTWLYIVGHGCQGILMGLPAGIQRSPLMSQQVSPASPCMQKHTYRSDAELWQTDLPFSRPPSTNVLPGPLRSI